MKEVNRLKIKLKRSDWDDRNRIMRLREISKSSKSDGEIAC
jgi:hypothetical protein